MKFTPDSPYGYNQTYQFLFYALPQFRTRHNMLHLNALADATGIHRQSLIVSIAQDRINSKKIMKMLIDCQSRGIAKGKIQPKTIITPQLAAKMLLTRAERG